MGTRKSDFAGSWYPAMASECEQAIEEFSNESISCPKSENEIIGGIVPHAGWYYSGRIACSVIKCMKNQTTPDTIVIFGKHLHQRSKNSIMREGLWETPLGNLEIDQELAEILISKFSFQIETTDQYDQDNTIELQLPFIKYFFPDIQILPIGAPPSMNSLRIGEEVAEISKTIGRKILVLGSTDLTHYGYNYGYHPMGTGEEAIEWVKKKNDKQIIDLFIEMDAANVIQESLKNHNACCGGAAAAAISTAKVLGANKGNEIVYTTSYDIRPDTSFVGYVGIVFS